MPASAALPPSPELFFDAAFAYQRTEALRAAIELDLFSAVSEGLDSVPQLARRCGTSEKGMRVLCDYLSVTGFFRKEKNRYRATQDTATFLDRRSPAYLGGTLEFLHNPGLREGYAKLTAAVRKGGTVISAGGLTDPERAEWVAFARAMVPMMALQTQLAPQLIGRPLDAKLKVLDIAAGHGMFGIEVAKRFPDATIVGLDWPSVLEVAQANAQRAGVAQRYRTIAGDAFKVDFGEGYDVVLLPNFLHHFGFDACVGFLSKVRHALVPGGMVVTIEFVPEEDRLSPPFPAIFPLAMLVVTAEGDAYTFPELKRMFERAGFSRNALHALAPSIQHAIVSQP